MGDEGEALVGQHFRGHEPSFPQRKSAVTQRNSVFPATTICTETSGPQNGMKKNNWMWVDGGGHLFLTHKHT